MTDEVIIFEGEEYLIINKPAGILVHPRSSVDTTEDTVTAWLDKKYPDIRSVGDDPALRPGIVHRLDKEVSGVFVVARTPSMFAWLKKQFQERTVKKEYEALVYGIVRRDDGEIRLPVQKSATRTIVKPLGQEGARIRSAVTSFEVIQRFQHYTHLRIWIETGRTNQIRVHLMNYGHSIVGDAKYCHPRYRTRKAFTRFMKCDRVFLHSRRLGFYSALDIWKEYEAPLPTELVQFLASLN